MKKVLFSIFIPILMIACQQRESTQTVAQTETTSTPAATDTAATARSGKTYTMNGKLVSRDAANRTVTIDNEEVPGGVMAPMVMAYELRGASVDTLPPDGSKITSTLHEQDDKYWVTDVKVVP